MTFDTLTVAWTKNLIAFLFDVMIFGVFSEAEQQVGKEHQDTTTNSAHGKAQLKQKKLSFQNSFFYS